MNLYYHFIDLCLYTKTIKQKNILDAFGWKIEDMGTAEAARAIEPSFILWCIPGFRENTEY